MSEQERLDQIEEAFLNGRAMPKPAPIDAAYVEWATELGGLFAEKVMDPIAYMRDESKRERERELLTILGRPTPLDPPATRDDFEAWLQAFRADEQDYDGPHRPPS